MKPIRDKPNVLLFFSIKAPSLSCDFYVHISLSDIVSSLSKLLFSKLVLSLELHTNCALISCFFNVLLHLNHLARSLCTATNTFQTHCTLLALLCNLGAQGVIPQGNRATLCVYIVYTYTCTCIHNMHLQHWRTFNVSNSPFYSACISVSSKHRTFLLMASAHMIVFSRHPFLCTPLVLFLLDFHTSADRRLKLPVSENTVLYS